MLFHGICRRAVRADQQFRRSKRPALQPVRRFRHDGSHGRHADVLGAVAGRGRVCRAAGLSLEHHCQVDVVCRHAVRGRRTAVPARPPGRSRGQGQSMSLLEVKSVTKRFGNLIAVRDVSLSVAPGELRAIIGPNGAGKTTFFNLISGFFGPTSGTIHFDARDVTALTAQKRVALGMARTFQITEIFPELTVFENVRIATEVASGFRLRPWLSKSEQAEIQKRVAQTLKLPALEATAH